jgi:hypothetical protein
MMYKYRMNEMKNKDCYGILEKVFPKGDQELRQVPAACMECSDRVLCLKEAIRTKEGLEMEAQLLRRAEEGGLINRFQRWSRKKQISRQIEKKK